MRRRSSATIGEKIMTENTPKLTVGELTDPMCPKCNVPMYGVSAMTFGKDKKFKHYAQCPVCDYKTKAK
jgi:hypothetical protein